MKKLLLVLLLVMMAAAFTSCSTPQGSSDEKAKITVAVGIVPQAAFVEAVAGDLVNVVTMIPTGYSPANYSPTTAQMQALSDSQVYFTIQMPAEQANILPKAQDFNPDLIIVDLRQTVSEELPLLDMQGKEISETDMEYIDPHIWLSPMRAAAIVQALADELSRIDSANEETYQANAADYIKELEELDGWIKQQLSGVKNKTFIMYHGAYGYFAHDYGLEMISIETGGKQATAAELENVIGYALKNDIKTVFYQDEFDDNQAQTVAEETGAAVQAVSPLSYDYIGQLKSFTTALTGAAKD